jgi:hypothetical protein
METNQIREARFAEKILSEAEDKVERAMAWYYYLDDTINFRFSAVWNKINRKTSSVEKRNVEVLSMSDAESCLSNMYVVISYMDDQYDVKLSEIEAIDADEQTKEALADWGYWLARGYVF